jgi:uncharacterized protein with HEPN domain
MSRDDPRVRLRHMLAYAQEAVDLMRNRKRADLDNDRALGLAILRCVKIVGRSHSGCDPTTLSKDTVAADHRDAEPARPRL